MKRTCKKITAVIAVISLLCCLLLSSAMSAQANEVEVSKISASLSAALNTETAQETVPVYIWTEDIDHSAVKEAVETDLGFTQESLSQTADLQISDETLQRWCLRRSMA